MSAEYSQNLFREVAPNFDIFSSVLLSGRINRKQIEEQKLTRRSGDMLTRNMFDNLLTALAISVHFSDKFCLTFLSLILSTLRESEWHERIFRAG